MRALSLVVFLLNAAAAVCAQTSPYLDPSYYQSNNPYVTMPNSAYGATSRYASPTLDASYYQSNNPYVTFPKSAYGEVNSHDSPTLDASYYQSNNPYVTFPKSAYGEPNSHNSPTLDGSHYNPYVSFPKSAYGETDSYNSPTLDPSYYNPYATLPTSAYGQTNTRRGTDSMTVPPSNAYEVVPNSPSFNDAPQYSSRPGTVTVPSADGAKVMWQSTDGSLTAFDNGVIFDKTDHSINWQVAGRRYRLRTGGRIEELPPSASSYQNEKLLPLHTTPAMHTSHVTYRVAGIPENDYLSVRNGPGMDYPLALKLGPKERGIILDESEGLKFNDATAWRKISVNGYTGWVNPKYLSLDLTYDN